MNAFSALLNRAKERDSYWEETAKLQFAIELKSLMDQEGISQKDLAEKSGVSQSQISQILAGSKNLSLKTMLKYTLALNHVVKVTIVPKNAERVMLAECKDSDAWMSFAKRNDVHRPVAARKFWEVNYNQEETFTFEAGNEARIPQAA